jgi:hypothetical protein
MTFQYVSVDEAIKRSGVRMVVVGSAWTTESTTLALKREEGGKIRVASLLWEAPKRCATSEAARTRSQGPRLR